MKKQIFSFVLLMCSFSLISAHTCSPQKVKCPIDGYEVEFCATMSKTIFGRYLDFQEKGAIGSHYRELINNCPKCNFSGYISDFKKKYSKSEKSSIRNVITKFTGLNLNEAQQCNVAGEIKIALNASNNQIANCFLIGSYLLRYDTLQKELRVQLQLRAADFLIKAVESKEFLETQNLNATIYFLIGELYRRVENFEEAIKYFDLSLNEEEKESWLENIIIKQREMAGEQDSNNEI